MRIYEVQLIHITEHVTVEMEYETMELAETLALTNINMYKNGN